MKPTALGLILALCSTAPLLSQAADTVPQAAAPVAHVFIQTTPGVMAFTTASNGKLTPVLGSPFSVAGQMEDISGKYLVSVGTTVLHTYPIKSTGALGPQVSQINTAYYGGSECGGTSGLGSVFDHNGKYLSVQLDTYDTCASWQTYQLLSNGFLQFLGDQQIYGDDSDGNVIPSTVPTDSSNNKFGYGVINRGLYNSATFCEDYYSYCPYISSFQRASNGLLQWNSNYTESDPLAESGQAFFPYSYASPQADPSGHLAVLMSQLDGYGDTFQPQLASFTINPHGGIASNNTYYNMPYVSVGMYNPIAMAMSPSGKLIAVAGHTGLQIFHFNGAAPPTAYSSLMLSGVDFDQVKWDSANHLYALSYDSAQLFVYTVTPTSITQAPGSPYNLPQYPYGTASIIVTK